jgi:hypothetical protein
MRKFFGIKKVCRPQVIVALVNAGVDACHIDPEFHMTVFDAVGVKIYSAGKIVKLSPDSGKSVPDVEIDV